MNAFVVLSSVLAAANAGIIAGPYTAGLPYAAGYHPYVYNGAPVAVAPAPVPVAPVASQYQAQDEFGNINYGYVNINSAKQEVGNAYGGVTGSYSYVDANGLPQRVDYIADALGFRVKATNLPVAPAHNAALPVAPVFEGKAPEPVADTPEVAEAKAKFFEAFEEAKNREKRSVIAAPGYGYVLPAALPAALPYGLNYGLPYAKSFGYSTTTVHAPATPYGYGYAAPAYGYAAPAYAAPAVATVGVPAARKAILTTTQLNPGHAVAYKVE